VDRPVTQPPHRVVAAPDLAPAIGYSHAVAASPGRVVYLSGQTSQDPRGSIAGDTVVEQFDVAAKNLTVALAAAGGRPEHLVSLHVFVTDLAAYRASRAPLGEVWRTHFGRHYPAMAVIGVTGLYDPAAKVELMGIAVIP
jgi:enamine deaminase RidA (YjgF/YER057c/UK114 family)